MVVDGIRRVKGTPRASLPAPTTARQPIQAGGGNGATSPATHTSSRPRSSVTTWTTRRRRCLPASPRRPARIASACVVRSPTSIHRFECATSSDRVRSCTPNSWMQAHWLRTGQLAAPDSCRCRTDADGCCCISVHRATQSDGSSAGLACYISACSAPAAPTAVTEGTDCGFVAVKCAWCPVSRGRACVPRCRLNAQ